MAKKCKKRFGVRSAKEFGVYVIWKKKGNKFTSPKYSGTTKTPEIYRTKKQAQRRLKVLNKC